MTDFCAPTARRPPPPPTPATLPGTKKPRSQEDVDALLKLLERPINTPPPPPPPVDPEGPKKVKADSDESDTEVEKV